jgi:hypothetical protein
MKSCAIFAANLFLVISVVVLLPVAASAISSPLDGTYEAQFDNVKSNGETVGCSLVYKNVLIDQRYEQGRPLFLVGNVTLNYRQSKYFLGFKIGVNEIVDGQSNTLKIKNPYLESRGKTHKPYKVMDAEAANYQLVAYEATGALAMLADIFDNKLGYGFAIGDGTFDLNGMFDFTVKDRGDKEGNIERSQEMINDFTKCALGLNDKYMGYLETKKK